MCASRCRHPRSKAYLSPRLQRQPDYCRELHLNVLGHLECVSGAEGVTEVGGNAQFLSMQRHLECVSGAEGAAEGAADRAAN